MTEITDQDIKALEMLYKEKLKDMRSALRRLGDALMVCEDAYHKLKTVLYEYHEFIKAEKEEAQE